MLALVKDGGTFQTDTDGTNHSDMPSTFKVLQSKHIAKGKGAYREVESEGSRRQKYT